MSLTFSERLAPWSLPFGSSRLQARINGTDVGVAATIVLDAAGTGLTMTPLQPLPGQALITAQLSGLRDLAGNFFSGSARTFTTGAGADTTPPTVVSVTPQPGQIGIGLQPTIALLFSESLDPATVNGNTISVFVGANELNVSPVRSVDNRMVTLTPSLTALSPITVVVTSGVKDLAGNAIADFSTTFMTGPTLDTSTGSVATVRPASGATGVPATTTITLLTTKPLNPTSVAGAFYVSQNGVLVTGTINITGSGTAIEFVPTVPFAAGAFVQVFLEGALDTSGRTVTTFQASFNITNPTSTAPSLVRVSPTIATVPLNTVFEAEISEPVATGSITAASVQLLDQNGVAVPATVTLRNGNRVIRVVPTAPLQASRQYQVRLNGVTDQQGTALPFTQRFWTTGTLADTVAPSVVAMNPPAGATNVGVNAPIRVRFSESVNPITISDATVAVTAAGFAGIAASMSFSNSDSEVMITPLQPLPDATTITVAIAGVEDPAGNLVTAAGVSWTTRTGADTTDPKVEATSVSAGQTGVPVNSVFTVRFDEPIDALSIGSTGTIGIALVDGVTSLTVPAIVTLEADRRTVTLAPVAPLPIGRSHTLRTTFGGFVRDLVGNSPSSLFLTFTTAYAGDVTAPVLMAASPRQADTGVPTNARIELIFNEPIDPAALAGITLQGATPVPLTYALTNSNRTVQLVPAGLLTGNTLHTIHVQDVRDPSGNIGVVSDLTFTTAAGADLIGPSVTARSPASQAIGVAPNVMLHVTFSERIDPSTVSETTFRLTHGATSALISSEVVVAADRLSATLRPLSPLLPETTYSYNITNFRDLSGNSGGLGGVSFTTGPAVDEIAPAVQRITPFAGAVGVPVNVQIVVEMSEPVDAASVAGSVTIPGVTATTTLSTDGRVLTFVPSNLLAPSTNYTVTVNGLRDLAGQPMTAPASAGFLTSATATADTTAPTLSAISPSITTNVPVTTNVVLTFSERLAPWSLTDDTPQMFARISGTDTALAATVTLDTAGTGITITPLQPLPGSSLITVRMSGLKDLAGNVFNGSRTFTTGAGTDTTPPTVLAVTPTSGQTGIGLLPSISIVFSESLDLNTVNGNTFAVFTGATELSISPTHSADNRIITIRPALPALTPITVVVTSGVKDLAGNASADFSTAFTTGPTVDVSNGSVATSRPATGSSGVPATTTITLLTTKPVNPASLAGAFYVSQNGVLVNGTINLTGAGTAIEFVPTAPLTAGAFVQVFLDGALDTSGRTITTFQSSFTIVPNAATTAPSVVRSSPGSSNAPRNAVFEVEISEPVAAGSITAATVQLLDQGSTVVPMTVTLRNGNRVIRIVPNSTLVGSNSYQLRLNGVTDQQGTALPFFARSWTTGASTDTASPTVVGMTPPANSANVGVNAVIRVRFSEAINPITVSAATIALTGPGFTAIPSSVNFNSGDTEVTVTPLQPLPDQSGLTVAVSGVEDLAGNPITPASAQWTTRVGADTVDPRLEAVSVFGGQADVPVNSVFTMRYDEPLDPLSIGAGAGVALIDNTTSLAVASTVTLEADGRTITLVPNAPLVVSRSYNLRTNFGTLLRDMAGNSPSSLFQTFTTASVSDTQPPHVRLTNPDQGAAAVPRNVDLQVLFDEPINAATAVGVKLMQAGVEVPTVRTISNSNRTVSLTPSTILAANTTYDLVAADVRDTAGNAMTSPVITTFTTGAGADLVGPALPTMSPTGTGVPVTTAVTVTFAEPINPLTVPGVLVLRATNTQAVVNTTVTYSADRRTVTLTPMAPLAAATQYTVILVSTGITDLAGNVMTATTFVTFTTQ